LLLEDVIQVDMSLIFFNLKRLVLSFILTLPIAWNREKKTQSVGVRTYPLVALGSCAFVLTGLSSFTDQEAEARILYGVITGMGFIGGGAVIKDKDAVKGTANAAGLWCTGGIGTAVAFSRFEIAFLLALSVYLIFLTKEKFGD